MFDIKSSSNISLRSSVVSKFTSDSTILKRNLYKSFVFINNTQSIFIYLNIAVNWWLWIEVQVNHRVAYSSTDSSKSNIRENNSIFTYINLTLSRSNSNFWQLVSTISCVLNTDYKISSTIIISIIFRNCCKPWSCTSCNRSNFTINLSRLEASSSYTCLSVIKWDSHWITNKVGR